ncbi:DUF5691 domain-containing protein [Methylosinus sp. Sm6]|uniref:DUF5691 domain-containing protein n=1 Tax=Methylosinus sp. Sm6 TaxID=2866948 RepID=UPI001C98F3C2|nr:DUF5691 domain-containing protein [Methylosinus sp. Sm6]MBY6241698.1 DUF5691 domain-containing protein [Methylosinus sp. Sm6]
MKRAAVSSLLPGFVVGTSRRTPDYSRLALPPADPKADLKALALLAMALRFAPPLAPDTFFAASPRDSARRLVTQEQRALMLRLFASGKPALAPQDDLAFAVALALERARVAPHPFDFHRLEPFLRTHAERLGADALAFIERDKAVEERRGYFDAEFVVDDNWNDAAPARRVDFLERRRSSDPRRARELAEAAWPGESADMRFRLLKALRVGLCIEDRAFLEGLAKDRAPKVRDLAARLLGKLAGADPMLAEAMTRVRVGSQGLLRKRLALTMELPATVAKDGWRNWVRETFAEIDIADFVSAVGATEEEAVEAAKGDAPLLGAMLLMALRARRFDLIRKIAPLGVDPLWLLIEDFFADSLDLPPEDRQAFAAAILQADAPNARGAGLLTQAMNRLLRILEAPLAASTFDHLLQMAMKADAQAVDAALSSHLVALAPAERLARLRSRLEAGASDAAAHTLLALDLLDSLESVSTHDN